ncbi:hypothetical protein ACIP98_06555 [Streptomyces sp. NPDC088354]|uniref:hypothetical protein n=1 Tax=unclassified Streptomyces TaxID=2593676 RepID=UPI0029BD5758|nr:hypothetical protein [Streptomyces sp. MI02-7b]MDX3071620.1 hypothetical protein [Streptomyces sp. MI02-7b]
MTDLDAVADALYALAPEDFTAARDEHVRNARRSGDRALAARIAGLRRPSLAAWAGNLLVREHGDEVAALLGLGEALRRAHRDLDGAQLRALGRQQRALVDALGQQAARLAADAGRPLAEAALDEVRGTLHAALADAGAARAWATGRLVRPLSGTVDFEQAVGGAPPGAVDGTADGDTVVPLRSRPHDAARRRRRLDEARRHAERARNEALARDADLADARTALDAAAARLGELAEAARRAEEDRRRGAADHERALRRVADAEESARAAAGQADAAATRVGELAADLAGPGSGG